MSSARRFNKKPSAVYNFRYQNVNGLLEKEKEKENEKKKILNVMFWKCISDLIYSIELSGNYTFYKF